MNEVQAFWLLLGMFKQFPSVTEMIKQLFQVDLNHLGTLKTNKKIDSRKVAKWTDMSNLTPFQNPIKTTVKGPWFVHFKYKSTLTDELFGMLDRWQLS